MGLPNVNKLMNIIYGLARAFPAITYIILMTDYLITMDINKPILAALLFSSGILNHVIKHYLMKPIMGDNKYDILGKGTRPKNAKNCGLFIDGKLSKTYGMPSGHSVNAAFFSTYYMLEVLNGMHVYKTYLLAMLMISTMFILYSRLKFRCHTIQQVILGGMLGMLLGNISYKFLN